MEKKPIVISETGKQIPFTFYQLAQAKYALSILSVGMKIRHVNLKSIKKAIGLSGKTVQDCLIEVKAKMEQFKTETAPLLNTTEQSN